MYRHILIPTDGSELANRAVVHGLSLAKSVGAKITAPGALMPSRQDETPATNGS
jgi:nucleotide-binding universal stress UspA family protein